MARFLEIKSMNPKYTHKELAKELGYSASSVQCYREDIDMFSPYRVPPNSHKRWQKISNANLNDDKHNELDVKRPQMTSIDLKRTHKWKC